MELQAHVEELRKKGRGLAALSYDPPEVLQAFSKKHGITFPLLSDRGSAIIGRYGLLNTEIPRGDQTYGIPYPGTFIVNARGVVLSRFFEPNYRIRNTTSSLGVRLGDDLAKTGTRISGAHLDVVTFSSDETVAPGNRLSLVLEIVPRPEMHIYSPSASGYKPLALRINRQPAIVVHPIPFPPTEEYFFKPLKESVQVYMKPFRLVQDVTVLVTPETRELSSKPGAALTIEGTLEYQACDDEVCYLPAAVPVRWSIRLRPLER